MSVNQKTGVKRCATSGRERDALCVHCYRVTNMSILWCGVHFTANLLVLSLAYCLLLAISYRNIILRFKRYSPVTLKKYHFSKGWKWTEEHWQDDKLLIKSLKYSTEKQILNTITLQNIHPLFHNSTNFISYFYAVKLSMLDTHCFLSCQNILW